MVLLDCVWRCYEDGEFFEIVDTRLMNNFYEKQMNTILLLGILCLYPNQMQGQQWGIFAKCLQVIIIFLPLPSTSWWLYTFNKIWFKVHGYVQPIK
jgi:hypothetical protein